MWKCKSPMKIAGAISYSPTNPFWCGHESLLYWWYQLLVLYGLLLPSMGKVICELAYYIPCYWFIFLVRNNMSTIPQGSVKKYPYNSVDVPFNQASCGDQFHLLRSLLSYSLLGGAMISNWIAPRNPSTSNRLQLSIIKHKTCTYFFKH